MGRAKKNVEVEAQVIARGNVVPMMTETESEETVQYVSDEDAAREDRLVSEIRMITEQTKQVVLFNSIEIGRRLTEAKAMVKRGTWGTWLKERVDYSQRTANNFMKIYQEYGRNGLAEKSQALANLSYTQALALIDLPEDERARFAEERKAGEMALRKLQEEVRQEKEKVTAVKELANRNAAEAEAKFADELKQKDTQMAKLTAEKAKVAAQIEVLEKRAAEAEKSNQKRQKEAIGIALEEERKKLDAAAEKQSELLKQIDELNGQRDRQVAEARRKADARNVGVHAPMLDAYTEFVIDAPSSVLQVLWDFPAHFLNLLLGSPTRVGIASHHAVDICVEEIASAVLGTGNRVMRWERGGLYPRFLPLVTAFLHVLQNAHGDFLALLVDAGEFSHCHLSSPSSRFDPENLSIERALASGS